MLNKTTNLSESNGKSSPICANKLSVAPMMDWTDRHCRYFLRGIAPQALLYTEMVTASAILRGDRQRLLRFDPAEHPVALQLGGNDPAQLAEAASLGAQAGYDEINLNCGCPSDKVRDGAFGACLMRDPLRVARSVAAMKAAVNVPVTVKMRIGTVDGSAGDRQRIAQQIEQFDADDWAALRDFIAGIAAAGCEVMIVHARKAVLGGYSPKDNREIPPLRYDVVQRLRAEFSALRFVLNGGLRTAAQAREALSWCDGIMLGREAYHRPQVLAEIAAAPFDIRAQLARMADYTERELRAGERLSAITRHMLGLMNGRPGAREFRRLLSEGSRSPGADAKLILQAGQLAA